MVEFKPVNVFAQEIVDLINEHEEAPDSAKVDFVADKVAVYVKAVTDGIAANLEAQAQSMISQGTMTQAAASVIRAYNPRQK